MKNTLEEKKEVIKNLYLSGTGEEFIAMQLGDFHGKEEEWES